MKNFSQITLFLLTFTCVSNVQSQNELSLVGAIKIGMQNNYQIQISNQRSAIAKMNNSWGAAGLWPSLDFSLSNGNNINDQDNPTSFINGQFSTTNLRGALDLNWTLFSGFKARMSKGKLETIEEQSEGNAQLIIENTVQSIILGYYRLRVEQDKLQILEKTLNSSNAKYEYYSEQLKLGVSTSFELNQFQSNLLTDSSNYLMQKQAVLNAQKNMNLILAKDENQAYNLTDSLTINKINLTYEELEKQMLEENKNLKNQYLNNQVLKKDISLQKSAMYPVISFGAGANRTDNWFEFEGQRRSGNSLNYYANFTLSYRLFNGGNIKRSIKSAELQYKIDELTSKEMEFSLKQDLKTYFSVLNNQMEIFNLNNRNELLNLQNLQIAEQKLKQGALSSFEFRDLQIAQLRASMTRIESSFQYMQTHLEVLRLTGDVVD